MADCDKQSPPYYRGCGCCGCCPPPCCKGKDLHAQCIDVCCPCKIYTTSCTNDYQYTFSDYFSVSCEVFYNDFDFKGGSDFLITEPAQSIYHRSSDACKCTSVGCPTANKDYNCGTGDWIVTDAVNPPSKNYVSSGKLSNGGGCITCSSPFNYSTMTYGYVDCSGKAGPVVDTGVYQYECSGCKYSLTATYNMTFHRTGCSGFEESCGNIFNPCPRLVLQDPCGKLTPIGQDCVGSQIKEFNCDPGCSPADPPDCSACSTTVTISSANAYCGTDSAFNRIAIEVSESDMCPFPVGSAGQKVSIFEGVCPNSCAQVYIFFGEGELLSICCGSNISNFGSASIVASPQGCDKCCISNFMYNNIDDDCPCGVDPDRSECGGFAFDEQSGEYLKVSIHNNFEENLYKDTVYGVNFIDGDESDELYRYIWELNYDSESETWKAQSIDKNILLINFKDIENKENYIFLIINDLFDNLLYQYSLKLDRSFHLINHTLYLDLTKNTTEKYIPQIVEIDKIKIKDGKVNYITRPNDPELRDKRFKDSLPFDEMDENTDNARNNLYNGILNLLIVDSFKKGAFNKDNYKMINDLQVNTFSFDNYKSLDECDVIIFNDKNNKKQLDFSINSILNQDNTNIKIHLINNYGQKIDYNEKIIVHEFYGLDEYESYNKLINELYAKYVMIQNCGNFSFKDRVNYSISLMEHEDADIFGCAFQKFGDGIYPTVEEHPNQKYLNSMFKKEEHTRRHFLKCHYGFSFEPYDDFNNFIQKSTCMFKRSSFIALGGFVDKQKYKSHFDEDFPIGMEFVEFIIRSYLLGAKFATSHKVLSLVRSIKGLDSSNILMDFVKMRKSYYKNYKSNIGKFDFKLIGSL